MHAILEHDHESLALLLDEFKTALAANEITQALEKLDLFWARLAMHIRAEHLCLFPALLNAAPEKFGRIGSPSLDEVRAAVAELRDDHNFFMDSLAQAIKILREARALSDTGQATAIEQVRQRIAAVAARLAGHNVTEEEMVYRWPALLLDDAKLAQLEADIKEQLQNLPARFRAKENE